MGTIQNKKGGQGFMVTPWNWSPACAGGGIIDLVKNRGELPESMSVQIAVRHVQIHSCGKKVMRLAELIAGRFVQMARREFDPATPLYDTLEAAEQAARDLYAAVRESMAARNEWSAEMHEGGSYQYTEFTPATIEAHRAVAAKLRDGSIPLEIIHIGART